MRIKVRILRITPVTKIRDTLVSSHPCLMAIEGMHTHDLDTTTKTIAYCLKKENDVESWAPMFARKQTDIHIRLQLETIEEFDRLFKIVKTIAQVNYVVKPSRCNKKIHEWSKTFICHHGGRSKRKNIG